MKPSSTNAIRHRLSSGRRRALCNEKRSEGLSSKNSDPRVARATVSNKGACTATVINLLPPIVRKSISCWASVRMT